jgi:ribonuclease BN (tRNA processing enzyme)
VFRFRLVGLILVVGVAVMGWFLTCGAWRLEQEVARVGPLDDRNFARLTVVTAGTGGRFENPERRGPVIAVGLGARVVLVDAGRAVADALRLSTIPVSQPDAVYLSNLLPQNTIGLDDLLLTQWINGRQKPLRVIGPAGTRALTENLLSAHQAGIAGRAGGLGTAGEAPRFDVIEISGGWSEEVDGLSVQAEMLPGGPIEALGYRFSAGGRSVVVSGAGWSPDALVELSRDADMLVHEAVFVPTPQIAEEMGMDEDAGLLLREAAEHTSIADVGSLAQRAGVKTLVLVRMRPPPIYDVQVTSIVDDDFDGRIVIAVDGTELIP